MKWQTLVNRGFQEPEARQIAGLVNGTVAPEKYSRVTDWLAQCYNRPSDNELIMAAIDEVLGGFGVEAIRGRYVDSYHQDIQAEYVNMGDTYDLTILLDHETGRYHATSWGDWVESHERARQLC